MSIGNNVIIHGNIFIYGNTFIKSNVVIASFTVIGIDSFGFEQNESLTWKKFPNLDWWKFKIMLR